MTPIDRLAVWIADNGGGWFQCWTQPEGWAVMVYRDGAPHAHAMGPTLDEALRMALAALGVTDG